MCREGRVGLFCPWNTKQTQYLEELRLEKEQGKVQVNFKVFKNVKNSFPEKPSNEGD